MCTKVVICPQACVISPVIILLSLHSDMLEKSLRIEVEEKIKLKMSKDYPDISLFFTCVTNSKFQQLIKELVLNHYWKMSDSCMSREVGQLNH